MGYTLTYIDRQSSETIEKHKATWYSEVCAISNNGLELGYDVLIEEDDERATNILETV